MLGSLLGHFLLGFGATFVGLVPSSFLGARVSGYCCNVCVCRYMCSEFYLSSVWGVLISFWSVFKLVFSPTLLSLFIIFTLLLLSFLLLLLFIITVIIISTELLALCDGCLAWGWVWRAGARGWVAGRAGLWGALATWVWGQQLQPPGSWAPNLHYYATQALNCFILLYFGYIFMYNVRLYWFEK